MRALASVTCVDVRMFVFESMRKTNLCMSRLCEEHKHAYINVCVFVVCVCVCEREREEHVCISFCVFVCVLSGMQRFGYRGF
jgi:hypothetical protein